VLVFARTRHRAKRVGRQLENAGYQAASMQGGLSQTKRQEALDGFRDGSCQVLVVTDIAASGIDVSSISHVINYDMPATIDDYTYRIGRAGRAAKTGDAFTFITRDDDSIVSSIEHLLGEKMERRTLKDFDYRKQAPLRDVEPSPSAAKATASPGKARTIRDSHHRCSAESGSTTTGKSSEGSSRSCFRTVPEDPEFTVN